MKTHPERRNIGGKILGGEIVNFKLKVSVYGGILIVAYLVIEWNYHSQGIREAVKKGSGGRRKSQEPGISHVNFEMTVGIQVKSKIGDWRDLG